MKSELLNSSPSNEDKKNHRVPFATFFIWTVSQFILAIIALRLIVPGIFSQEIAHPGAIVLWTFLLGLPLSAFEYFYHRYLLHSAVLPFMAAMHRAHSTHHGLTYVKAPVNPKDPARLVEVKSEFPVEEPHQEESMMFPLYSLPIFIAVFLILFAIPLKLIFPAEPILLSLMFSV